MTNSGKTELTPYQKQMVETKKKIDKYRLNDESFLVASCYKNPELVFEFANNVTLEDFSSNYWKCYWTVVKELVTVKKATVIDELTFNQYLLEHPKVEKVVTEAGGWELVEKAMTYTDDANAKAKYENMKKWSAVYELLKKGFNVADRLSDFADMTIDDIYAYYDATVNTIFSKAETSYATYDIMDGMDEHIRKLDSGANLGFPMSNSTILNNMTGGLRKGTITMIGASSGVGKSLLAFLYTVPQCIKDKTPVCIIVNEESEERWRNELLVYVANQVLGLELSKSELMRGHFNSRQMDVLKQTLKWINEQKEEHLINIVPLERYTVKSALKIMKRYCALGVERFVLDTMKIPADAVGEQPYVKMMQDTIDLYNFVKESVHNLQLTCTAQLTKGATNKRKMSQYDLSMSKNMADVMSLMVFYRPAYADEYAGQKNQLNCWREDGSHRIPFTLDEDKRYLLAFIVKSRYCSSNGDAIVIEWDAGKNKYREIGKCSLMEDF